MLLGTGFKKGYSNSEEALESGDLIVFFTDGIIEARGVDGKEIGFAKFEEVLLSLGNTDIRGMELGIREWFNQTVCPGPQEDA